jgi:diacylglycerol kinase (ATP)
MKLEKENNINNRKSFYYQFKSFGYAFRGLVFFFTTEQKATIQTALAFIAVLSGFLLKLRPIEWCFVVTAIVFVFITEILNSVVEKLIDLSHPERNVQVGMIKDMAAGAVLFSSLGAVVIAIIIYLPKIVHLFTLHNKNILIN